MFSVELQIEPTAKGRPKFTKKGFAYTPSKTRQAENALKLLLRAAFIGRPIMKGAVAVSIVVNIRRPKSVPAKKRPWPSVKPDLDNLVKTVLDSANGIIWLDDSQVVSMQTEKRYAAYGSIWICANEY